MLRAVVRVIGCMSVCVVCIHQRIHPQPHVVSRFKTAEADAVCRVHCIDFLHMPTCVCMFVVCVCGLCICGFLCGVHTRRPRLATAPTHISITRTMCAMFAHFALTQAQRKRLLCTNGLTDEIHATHNMMMMIMMGIGWLCVCLGAVAWISACVWSASGPYYSA